MIINVFKVFVPATLSFFFGLLFAEPLIRFLIKNEMWKKKARTQGLGGGETPIFNSIHKDKEVSTPRMGGIIIWASVLVTITLMWLLWVIVPSDVTEKLTFLSRNQTWLPLFTLLIGSLVGLVDDYKVVQGRGGYIAGGLPLSLRIAIVLLIGFIGAWWFNTKLGISYIYLPSGYLQLGWLFYPAFMITMLALFSGGVIDGIDGLAGGIFAIMFGAYAGIAFFQNQIDLSAFCATISGGILAFLWFNIPPARFYMSETGILGLTTTLTVVAYLTNSVIELPLIAFPLLVASASDIIQIGSKKLRGKKVFLVAPIHHHFEALGWPSYQVTMRFWIVSIITALMGMIIALIGK